MKTIIAILIMALVSLAADPTYFFSSSYFICKYDESSGSYTDLCGDSKDSANIFILNSDGRASIGHIDPQGVKHTYKFLKEISFSKNSDGLKVFKALYRDEAGDPLYILVSSEWVRFAWEELFLVQFNKTTL